MLTKQKLKTISKQLSSAWSNSDKRIGPTGCKKFLEKLSKISDSLVLFWPCYITFVRKPLNHYYIDSTFKRQAQLKLMRPEGEV